MMLRKLTLILSISLLLFTQACTRNENVNRANVNATANANRSAGGPALSDNSLALRTKLALVANRLTSGYETDVEVKDGVVTLGGKVETNEARSAAEEIVRKIDGVRNVINQLQVTPEAKRTEVSAPDSKIKNDIQKLLDTDPQLQSLALSVDSTAGVVTLDGAVDTTEQLWHAAQAIRKVAGVKSVDSHGVMVREDIKA